MDLYKQLKSKQEELQSHRTAAQVDAIREVTEQLIKEGIEKLALKEGYKIPSFSLPNATGKIIQSEDFLSKGPLVISFYRGSWCPYCNLELRAYQQRLKEIHSLGAEFVAISPELPDYSLSNQEKLALEFEVLSDVGNQVARKFGLVFQIPPKTAKVYQELNTDITKNNGDDTWELPLPATYLVRKDGTVAFAYVNADYTYRCDPEEIINHLKSI